MYVVVEHFNDLKDNHHEYIKNDVYPHKKMKVDQERIEELSSKNNKLQKVLIKKVELDEATVEQLISFAEIEGIDLKSKILDEIKVSTAKNDKLDLDKELKELQKMAKKLKIDFSEETSIEELKDKIEQQEKNK